MKKVLSVLKAIMAAVGAAATAISTAAVPDKWRSLAAVIGAAVTTALVYITPNIK